MTKNPSEFENMVTDYFKKEYNSVQLYGRKGQKQYGIDIIITFINSNREHEFIVVQCKNYSPKEAELDDIIDDAIEGSRRLPGSVSKIVIALGCERDTKIHDYILKKSPIGLVIEPLFWEDISSLIASDKNLLNNYYLQISNNTISIEELLNFFNESIQECHILDIIRNNPLYGMPKDFVWNMQIFCIEIEKQLDKAILLQQDTTYQKISEFSNWIGYYNSYLAKHMTPAGVEYYSVSPDNSYDQMKKEITLMKNAINECYMAINSGCSLFI